ncbi:uncharacterized protein LOC127130679 [Lathyrus oleraceus]|uniref:uncharacterized protein LOC127130679 n=1 Tax=Pisum sativum TaxID=3888 RepID=UPI0021D07282|nr:uncharacterized protein LOC127130679 [Pisum sativum]
MVCILLEQVDVILGINWLELNQVFTKCFDKLVQCAADCKCSDDALLEAKGKGVVYDLPGVCEFPKVFPEDISDLPPEREVDFSIDLVPGTSLVSMTSYRMSASELGKLKKQLKDLLEKKYVQPSVSLWGVSVLLVKEEGR